MPNCSICGAEQVELWRCRERVERAEGELEMARIEIEWLRRVMAEKEQELTRLERSLAAAERVPPREPLLESNLRSGGATVEHQRSSLMEHMLQLIGAWQRNTRGPTPKSGH
jgi:hypothetical protein